MVELTVSGDQVAATPTGPFFSHDTPEARFLTLLGLFWFPTVEGDRPQIGPFGYELPDVEAELEVRCAQGDPVPESLHARWLVADAAERGVAPPCADFLRYATVCGLLLEDEEFERARREDRPVYTPYPPRGRRAPG